MASPLPQDPVSASVTVANVFPRVATLTAHLTDAQLLRLHWCAKGNTLRFETQLIVDALVAAGYAKVGVGRVVTLTAKGQEYLWTNAVKLRLTSLGAWD